MMEKRYYQKLNPNDNVVTLERLHIRIVAFDIRLNEISNRLDKIEKNTKQSKSFKNDL